MKLGLWKTARDSGYTITLLKLLAEKRGIAWVEPDEADIILVSVCDVDDLPKIKQARKVAGDKPLIMGGVEAFSGRSWLAWADYVWVGEAWDFFNTLAEGGLDAVKKHRAMLSREKPEATAARYINWAEVPLVKTGKGTYYFLAARGCSNKCKFCFTSWINPYRVAPYGLLQSVLDKMEEKPKTMKLHYISNDNVGVPVSDRLINPTVRISDYLKDPQLFNGAKSFHFGIERFSEAGRKEWGKPISNKDLIRVFIMLEKTKKEAVFYIISGLPETEEEMKEFLGVMPYSAATSPRMFLKLTYFDAAPHTPLQRYDIGRLVEIDRIKVFTELISRNKRWRTFRHRSLAQEMWRTLFRRCDEQQAIKLGPVPDRKMSPTDYLNKVKGLGLGELIDGQQQKLPWDGIKLRGETK